MRTVLTTPRRESYREVSQTLHGRRSMLWALVTLVSVTLFGAADEARAQAVRDTAAERKHQADCRLAAQTLIEGQPAAKRDWALAYLGSCPQQQQVAVEMWETPPGERTELDRLFELSRKFKDERIFRRAVALAEDPAVDSEVRVTALGVLGSYLDPILVMRLSDLEERRELAGIRWANIFGVGGDLEAQETGRPLPADADDRIRSLVRDLAREAEDDLVRAQAWHLATRLGIEVSR